MSPDEVAAVYAMEGAASLEGVAETLLPQAESIARHLADLYSVDAQELVSAAYVALWEALRRYDPKRAELYRYVTVTVRQRLLDVVRSELPLDPRTWTKVQAMRQVIADWQQEQQRAPTDAELSRALGMSPAQLDGLYEAESRLLGPTSVEVLGDLGDGGGGDGGMERQIWLTEALATLPDREQKILYASYVAGYSTTEIAAALGVEASWVRRLRGRALSKLRAWLGDEESASAENERSNHHGI